MGCEQNDRPVCSEQSVVIAQSGAAYRPADKPEREPRVSVKAGFAGDPVPTVEFFKANGIELFAYDQGFPIYSATLPDPDKEILIEALVNGIDHDRLIVIPDLQQA